MISFYISVDHERTWISSRLEFFYVPVYRHHGVWLNGFPMSKQIRSVFDFITLLLLDSGYPLSGWTETEPKSSQACFDIGDLIISISARLIS